MKTETEYQEYLDLQQQLRDKCLLSRDVIVGQIQAFERDYNRSPKTLTVGNLGLADLAQWNESPVMFVCGVEVKIEPELAREDIKLE